MERNIANIVSVLSSIRFWCAIVFLLPLYYVTAQNAPLLTSEADTTQIRIGEQIQFKITVEADTTSVVFFPEGQTFSPLETVESYLSDSTRNQDRIRLQRTYALTQFDSGTYIIPTQRIEIDGRGYFTDSILVAVGDVPVDTLTQKMYDIKPIIEVDKSYAGIWKTILWVLLAILVIGAFIYFYFFKKKKLTEEEKEAMLPPYDRALLELKRLENSKYLIQDEYKKYYSELTAIVRSYLEEDANISALESTTRQLIEKLEMLKDSGELKLKENTIRQFQKILQTADLVKFARSKPPTSQAEDDRKAVETIVMKTKEALPEPTEEELMQQKEYQEELAKKRRKRKIIRLAAAALALLVISTAGLTAYYGPKYVWDTITRHHTKRLLEGEWVQSSYGFPPVLVETPEVLVRQDSYLTPDSMAEVKEIHNFIYRSADGLFLVGASSKLWLEPKEPDFAQSLELALEEFESLGARNIITKEEVFTTVGGVKGVKIYGSGNFTEPGSGDKIRGQYTILMFGGKGFQQQLMLSWEEGDMYAEEIIERILSTFDVKTEV